MFFILGILVGLLLAVIAMLSVRRYENALARTAKRLENMTKEKGEVFVESEGEAELKEFIDNLPTE